MHQGKRKTDQTNAIDGKLPKLEGDKLCEKCIDVFKREIAIKRMEKPHIKGKADLKADMVHIAQELGINIQKYTKGPHHKHTSKLAKGKAPLILQQEAGIQFVKSFLPLLQLPYVKSHILQSLNMNELEYAELNTTLHEQLLPSEPEKSGNTTTSEVSMPLSSIPLVQQSSFQGQEPEGEVSLSAAEAPQIRISIDDSAFHEQVIHNGNNLQKEVIVQVGHNLDVHELQVELQIWGEIDNIQSHMPAKSLVDFTWQNTSNVPKLKLDEKTNEAVFIVGFVLMPSHARRLYFRAILLQNDQKIFEKDSENWFMNEQSPEEKDITEADRELFDKSLPEILSQMAGDDPSLVSSLVHPSFPSPSPPLPSSPFPPPIPLLYALPNANCSFFWR